MVADRTHQATVFAKARQEWITAGSRKSAFGNDATECSFRIRASEHTTLLDLTSTTLQPYRTSRKMAPVLDTVSPTPAFILGALTSIGGSIGYARTGSIPSIAAGLTVGALYGLGGYRIHTRTSYGVELALLASIILAGSSLPRAIKTGKPLPWGLSVLAVSGLLVYGRAYTQNASPKSA